VVQQQRLAPPRRRCAASSHLSGRDHRDAVGCKRTPAAFAEGASGSCKVVMA
jgi:hypothetical protein